VPGVAVQPGHLVPQHGVGQGILSGQERRQDPGQRPGRHRVHRAIEAQRALPRRDPQVQSLHDLARVRLAGCLGRLAR
jgi:hypothetical protein